MAALDKSDGIVMIKANAADDGNGRELMMIPLTTEALTAAAASSQVQLAAHQNDVNTVVSMLVWNGGSSEGHMPAAARNEAARELLLVNMPSVALMQELYIAPKTATTAKHLDWNIPDLTDYRGHGIKAGTQWHIQVFCNVNKVNSGQVTAAHVPELGVHRLNDRVCFVKVESIAHIRVGDNPTFDDKFIVGSVHLSNHATERDVRDLLELSKTVSETLNLPIILGGDFNYDIFGSNMELSDGWGVSSAPGNTPLVPGASSVKQIDYFAWYGNQIRVGGSQFLKLSEVFSSYPILPPNLHIAVELSDHTPLIGKALISRPRQPQNQ
jgi:hypothetical protein